VAQGPEAFLSRGAGEVRRPGQPGQQQRRAEHADVRDPAEPKEGDHGGSAPARAVRYPRVQRQDQPGKPDQPERVLLEIARHGKRRRAERDHGGCDPGGPGAAACPDAPRAPEQIDRHRGQRRQRGVAEADREEDARLEALSRNELKHLCGERLQRESQRQVGNAERSVLEQGPRLNQIVAAVSAGHERRAPQ
jgi:hypothetical protein